MQKNAHVVTIDSYEDVPENDEVALKKAVASQPVSVAIEAGGRDFQFYSGVKLNFLNLIFIRSICVPFSRKDSSSVASFPFRFRLRLTSLLQRNGDGFHARERGCFANVQKH